jgi:ribonucleoside-diphosphate reductase alpha chain
LLFENLRPKLAAGDVGRAPSPADVALPTTDDARRTTNSPTTQDARRTTGSSFHAADALSELVDLGDAPSCHVCGSIMVRNGSCYKCMSCGSTSGCS